MLKPQPEKLSREEKKMTLERGRIQNIANGLAKDYKKALVLNEKKIHNVAWLWWLILALWKKKWAYICEQNSSWSTEGVYVHLGLLHKGNLS